MSDKIKFGVSLKDEITATGTTGRRQKKYLPAEGEHIRAAILAGKSYKEIADEIGRTYGSVKNHVAHHWPELIKPRPYYKMNDEKRKVERNHPPSYSVEEALAIGYKIAGVKELRYNPKGEKS